MGRVKVFVGLLFIAISSQSYGYEFLIFKQVHQDIGIASLPFKYTVWHTDPLNVVKYKVEGEAEAIVDLKERAQFIRDEVEKIPGESLGGLAMMGLVAQAKMKKYGLSETPSAVLLDDEGNVVERWDVVTNGLDLLSAVELKR